MKAFVFRDVLEPAGKKPIRVLARVSVLRTEDGGRAGPFACHYRPNHNIGGSEDRIFYIGQVEVAEGAWVHPGEVCELPISFLNVRGLSELLHVGRKWRIQEGGKLVANAEIVSIAKEEPNHLPDPTSPSVTPPASAGGAPSVAADH
jgi:translation elongation factor EF-Tu-like GTPase